MKHSELDIQVELEEIDEYEIAKQKVANFTDEWPWLGDKINADNLTWPEIMDLVASHL